MIGKIKMDMVILKNGSEEAKVAVITIMTSLRAIFDVAPMAFYDLVMKCRDNNYSYFGDNMQKLEVLSLVQNGGEVHSVIRNVVLSAVSGEGLDLTLRSPIKEN